MKDIYIKSCFSLFLFIVGFKGIAQQTDKLTPFILIVQPIIVQSDEGADPA